jgi:hypothetical protein
MAMKRWKIRVNGKPDPRIIYAADYKTALAQAQAMCNTSTGVDVADIDDDMGSVFASLFRN